MYSDNKTKIRRFLRDPDGNLWEDSLLQALWNDEQRSFCKKYGFNESVAALRVPPYFQMTYIYPWEWAHVEHAQGKTYQAMIYHQQSRMVCCYPWETEHLGISTASETATGDPFTHPWEAYEISTPIDLSPIWLPDDFHSAIYMAYDNEPLEYRPYKEISFADWSFRIHSGKPQWWTTKEDFEQFFYLYPTPSAVWADVDGAIDKGMALHDDVASTISSEVGTIIDQDAGETNDNKGISTDLIDSDDNVLLVYRQYHQDITYDLQDPGYPRFLQKYIEYGVLAQAYRANTDGRIKSLSDYWEFRKTVSEQVLLRFKFNRLADRNFRLTGNQAPPRNRRGPRLPSTYPPI